jgi:hypothetical protein
MFNILDDNAFIMEKNGAYVIDERITEMPDDFIQIKTRFSSFSRQAISYFKIELDDSSIDALNSVDKFTEDQSRNIKTVDITLDYKNKEQLNENTAPIIVNVINKNMLGANKFIIDCDAIGKTYQIYIVQYRISQI